MEELGESKLELLRGIEEQKKSLHQNVQYLRNSITTRQNEIVQSLNQIYNDYELECEKLDALLKLKNFTLESKDLGKIYYQDNMQQTQASIEEIKSHLDGRKSLSPDEVCGAQVHCEKGKFDALLYENLHLKLPSEPGYKNMKDIVWEKSKQGSLRTQLNSPTSIAIDKANNYIYITDTLNSRIQIFTENGDHYFSLLLPLAFHPLKIRVIPSAVYIYGEGDAKRYLAVCRKSSNCVPDNNGFESFHEVMEFVSFDVSDFSHRKGTVFTADLPECFPGVKCYGYLANGSHVVLEQELGTFCYSQGHGLFGGAAKNQGNTLFGGAVNNQGNTLFGGAVNNQGNTLFGGAVNNQGNTLFGGAVNNQGNTLFGGAANNQGNTLFGGAANNQGNTLFGGAANNQGNTLFGGAVNNQGNTLFGGAVNNQGNTLFGGAANNQGNTLFGGAANNQGNTLFGGAANNQGNTLFGGAANNQGNTLFGGAVNNQGNSLFGGAANNQGNPSFGGAVNNQGNTLFGGAANNQGNTLFGGAANNQGNTLFGGAANNQGNTLFGGAVNNQGNSLFGGAANNQGNPSFGGAVNNQGNTLFGSVPATQTSLFVNHPTNQGTVSFGSATTNQGFTGFGSVPPTQGTSLFGNAPANQENTGFGSVPGTQSSSLFGGIPITQTTGLFGTPVTQGNSLFLPQSRPQASLFPSASKSQKKTFIYLKSIYLEDKTEAVDLQVLRSNNNNTLLYILYKNCPFAVLVFNKQGVCLKGIVKLDPIRVPFAFAIDANCNIIMIDGDVNTRKIKLETEGEKTCDISIYSSEGTQMLHSMTLYEDLEGKSDICVDTDFNIVVLFREGAEEGGMIRKY